MPERMIALNLEGKVALVTGGGRGIGKETAALLAGLGVKVAIFSNNQGENEWTAEEIWKKSGVDTLALTGDVGSEQDVEQAVQQTTAKLGAIDILINNAGMMSPFKPFHEVLIEEWDLIQKVNVRGAFLFSKMVVPQMMEKGSGSIVNISSIWGTRGGPDRSAYITSKFAVIGFTKALSEDLKPYNIRVNAVCPGPVNTKMMEALAPDVNKDNWLHPREIANVIVQLCLPTMSAISGAVIEAFGKGKPVGL